MTKIYSGKQSCFEGSLLINDFQQQNTVFAFDVLENWPEEVLQNDKIVIDESKRSALTLLVKERSMFRVIQFLQKMWVDHESTQKYYVLRCYTKWLVFLKSVSKRDEVIQYLKICNQCPVVAGSLQSLQDEELQGTAVGLVR